MVDYEGITLGSKAKDLTGMRSGLLVAVRPIGKKKTGILWLCDCDCGNQLNVVAAEFCRKERTNSCGCLDGHGSHGMSNTPTYRIWCAMKERCYSPAAKKWHRYGGRGIRICDHWMGIHGFENFLEDMGPRPSLKHSIDRINNEGHYEPGNCRWATPKEQSRNNSRNRIIEFNGESMCLTAWAEKLGIKRACLSNRIRKGWTIHDALSRPIVS